MEKDPAIREAKVRKAAAIRRLAAINAMEEPMPPEWVLRDLRSDATATINEEPSATKAEFFDETDVNKIVERFMRTGDPSVLNPQGQVGQYMNTLEAVTFETGVMAAARTRNWFSMLPEKVQMQFGNNPEVFAEFAQKRENAAEVLKVVDPEMYAKIAKASREKDIDDAVAARAVAAGRAEGGSDRSGPAEAAAGKAAALGAGAAEGK